VAADFTRLRQVAADSGRAVLPGLSDAATIVADGSTQFDSPPSPNVDDIKFEIADRLLGELNPATVLGLNGEEGDREVNEAIAYLLESYELPLRADRPRLMREIRDEILGLGPLQSLIDDPTVSEIMVNGPKRVFAERKGISTPTDIVFRDNDHVMRVIEHIISRLGRRIDEHSPMVDARLADGSRVNCIIPPVAIDGASITIRKFSRNSMTLDDLVRFNMLNQSMATFLQACVATRTNILVSGGTGTGKTTFLNALSAFIPPSERVVSIEDPAELQLRQPNLVRLETRPMNIEGKGEITQRQLVRNALRMRPERIIIGEVRGGEAFDMLQAMNTGHDGSLTTTHANSPRDALARVENMVLMASLDLPMRAIREQIAAAIHLVIQLNRLRDGSRRVTQVTEITAMEGERITMQDVFVFQQRGLDVDGKVLGSFQSTGLRPRLADRCEQQGFSLAGSLFMKDPPPAPAAKSTGWNR
jgi:pilus assembly protein CpaF